MSLVRDRIAQLLSSEEARPGCPRWPPDLFAACGVVLRETGAYERAVSLDPTPAIPRSWAREAIEVGDAWRRALDGCIAAEWPTAPGSLVEPPALVRDLWDSVVDPAYTLPGLQGASDARCVEALIKLLGLADQACRGIGIRSGRRSGERTLTLGLVRLQQSEWRSLCWQVPAHTACVLPKQHTPQRGLTLRSYSHHLALLPADGVEARWFHPHTVTDEVLNRLDLLNILVLPWPLVIDRASFRPRAPAAGTASELAGRFRYFEFDHRGSRSLDQHVEAALIAAKKRAHDVDLVVLPELAVAQDELPGVVDVCRKHRCTLICGVHVVDEPLHPEETGGLDASKLEWPVLKRPGNYAVFESSGWLAEGDPTSAGPSIEFQRKHHRWCLDAPQIEQYGLAGRLPSSCDNWEWAEIGRREIKFHTIERWLTIATLICEDLARQDPIAQAVRAVGPNLVVALLMDGPQISNRWSARYATVLAEDPGCSVLTLTSLGMAALTREAAARSGWDDRSRAIALWRDITGRDTVIELGPGDDAALLHVVCKSSEEYTADGRGDGGVAYFPTLAGWTGLSVPSARSDAPGATPGAAVPSPDRS